MSLRALVSCKTEIMTMLLYGSAEIIQVRAQLDPRKVSVTCCEYSQVLP